MTLHTQFVLDSAITLVLMTSCLLVNLFLKKVQKCKESMASFGLT